MLACGYWISLETASASQEKLARDRIPSDILIHTSVIECVDTLDTDAGKCLMDTFCVCS